MNRPLTYAALFALTLSLSACGPGSTTPPADTETAGTVPELRDEVPAIRAPNQHAELPDPRDQNPESAAGSAAARLAPTYLTLGPDVSAQQLPANAQTAKVELRVLVLSSGAGDYGLAGARAMLGENGVQFDVFDASLRDLKMSDLIRPDGVGRYQGVILTSSALSMTPDASGQTPSALNTTEWETLFEYERAYAVRQLALYGAPGTVPEDYGLRLEGTATDTTTLRLTSAGAGILSDLTDAPIPVRYAYTYPSKLEKVAGVSTTPIMLDPQGRVLGAVSKSADNRERLILTMAQNPALRHTQLMSYGLVSWLTKGVYLGEHRRFLQVDIDDWFLSGDHFNAATKTLYPDELRINGNDALSVRDQQSRLRSNFPVARNFRYAIAFNGGGSRSDVLPLCTTLFTGLARDSLSSASKCLNDTFDWVNHTRDHLRMDVMDAPTTRTQIADNFTIGARLGLEMSRKAMVTGEHSGLGFMDPNDDGTHNDSANPPKVDLGLGRSNPNLLNSAVSNGVRYLASDHSVRSHWDADCSTCGVFHPLNSGIFLVPRWPNGVAYHVTNPTEATTFYNSVYGPRGKFPYFDHDLSYSEFLDYESDVALNHVLDGGAFPHYMHQTNLRQYAYGKSLSSDWVNALLTKYSRYSTLPLNTLDWDALGTYMERRTREEKAKAAGKLSATFDRVAKTVTIQSSAPMTFSLTGGNSGVAYGAARIQQGNVSGAVTVAVTPR